MYHANIKPKNRTIDTGEHAQPYRNGRNISTFFYSTMVNGRVY